MTYLEQQTTADSDKARSRPVLPRRRQIIKLAEWRSVSTLTFVQLVTLLVLALCAFMASGCSTTQYQRMVYDALRQQDCLINQLDSFCARTFALDFYDYTAMRNDYIKSLENQPFTNAADNDNAYTDALATIVANPVTSH